MNTSHRSNKITRREWAAIVALMLLAFALRTIDLTRVPPGLHNDEVIETNIAETVVAGRLAIFFPEDTGSEGLHYYFAALFIHLFGDTVYALRLPAIFLSLISMCIAWALARRLFGPVAALTALAGFTVVFWTVAFGRIISHTIVIVPVAALTAYCFWRAHASTGRRAWLLWGAGGLCLGLSIYTYTAARVLPIIFLAFAAYVTIAHRAEWRRWFGGLAVTLGVAALVALPMILYLLQQPAADDLGFFDIDRPLVELRQGNLAPVVETTLRTLGMFAFAGDPLPYYTIPGRPVFEPLGALLTGAGIVIALVRWRRPQYAFALLWFFLSLAPGMFSQPAPNSTRTLAAQVFLFAFPGIAVAELIRKATEPPSPVARRRGRAGVGVFLALLFLGNLAWTVRDYFVVWPTVPEVRWWHNSGLYAIANDVQADPDTSPVVLCAPDELIDERKPWWKPAWQHLRYLLHRPDLALRYYNCADAMVFVAGTARYAVPDVADESALSAFPFFAQTLSSANPELLFLPDGPGAILRADASTALVQHLPDIAAASVVAYAPEAGGEPAQLSINFGDRVEFLGYTLSPSSFTPALAPERSAGASVLPPSSFELTTYWRVTAPLPPQLSQFTHLLDAHGNIVAQQDRLAITSASLQPGDIFAQIHHVMLPADLPDGEYAISIGLYSYLDNVRLSIVQDGQPRGDRLWLQAIQVGN